MRIVGMIILAIGLWGFLRPKELVAMIKRNFYRDPASRDLSPSPKRPVVVDGSANLGRQRLLALRIIALVWALVGLAIMIKG